MPYSNPTVARERSRHSSKVYAQRHPDRVKANGKRWYAKLAARAKELGLSMRQAKRLASLERRAREPGGMRNSHGLTASAYDAMLERQDGRCAICGGVGELQVDHEHVPGWEKLPLVERAKHVRGLLCRACNIFIGLCRDEVDVISQRALAIAKNIDAYLRRTP